MPNALEGDNDTRQRTSIDSAGDECYQEDAEKKRTPLPIKQVLVLCLMSFSEPVSLLVIFPFVNQMIEELGVTSDPKELGYYSGFVEGIFSVSQFFTIYFWGSLSDRIGRRPVLISGLCGVVCSTVMFGLSKSLTGMIVARAISGMLNGNSAVIKTVMAEITDETNQALAFAQLPLFWSMGAVIAPSLGGFLSHPAERYPSIFGFELLRQYPYLLPCLAGASFSILGLVTGALFLKETLPKDRHPDPTSEERRPLLASESQNNRPSYAAPTQLPESEPDNAEKHVPSVKEIMRIPYTRKVVMSYGIVAYITIAINAVMVLWLYTPVNAGGVGFSSAEIGTTLMIGGIAGAVIAAMIFPALERQMGALHLYRFSMMMQVLNILSFPLGHLFANVGGKQGAYLGVAVMLVMRTIAGMVLISNSILINRSAPSKHSRGTINGLAHMFASAARAIGPSMATSLFAFSMKNNILGGNLIWIALTGVALLGVVFSFRISDD